MTDPFRPLKNAFGRYATGICVASCVDAAGAPVAITINSFTSVSLDPPMILWCLERRASTFASFMASESYGVSVLRAEDEALSNRFASHEPAPLGEDEMEVWETGAPILSSRLAGFDCRIRERFTAGDHVILTGEVVRFDAKDGAPLLYFASDYARGPEVQG